MAKKKAKAKAKKGDKLNKAKVMKELHEVLKANGISAKIVSLGFGGNGGTACTCEHGATGFLRVVGGTVVCVCDH